MSSVLTMEMNRRLGRPRIDSNARAIGQSSKRLGEQEGILAMNVMPRS